MNVEPVTFGLAVALAIAVTGVLVLAWGGESTAQSRGELLLRVTHLEQQLAEAKEREAYWRKRAELYIDRASAKAGLTHEPIMADRNLDQLAGMIPALAGAGMMEYDSSKS